MTWIRTAVAVLACSAFLAACGGEDDSLPQTEVVTPSTTEAQVSDEPISTEDFLAAGDEICVETFSAVSAAEEDEADDAELYETRAALYEEMVDELQGLGTPEEDAGVEDLYIAADELVEANDEAAVAAEEGDDSAASEEADTALSAFQSAAVAIGFEDCSDAAAGIPVDTGDTGTPVPDGTTTPAVPTEPVPVEPAPAPEPVPVEPAPVPEPVPAPAPPPDNGGAAPTPAPEPADPPSSSSGGGIGPG